MTLPRFTHDETRPPLTWEDLTIGAPTIIGFAGLCSRALAAGVVAPAELSLAAETLLYAARQRGSFEIKAIKNAYDSAQRLLAVHVEQAPERVLAFRSRLSPQFTIQMLEGFRELCASGLVIHHLGHDFSLTHSGLQRAADIEAERIQALLAQAVELEFDE
ncbi:MAG TPA: hypothetical protein VL096_06825 [Pirellulaceae bacterium]|nr:hypothetical protein [Pirellulaceae bacterium]